MNYYKRKLPHWQLAGAEYFITIRLKGSLPHAAIKKLRSLKKIYEGNQEVLSKIEKVIQKKIFEKYETLLDNEKTGPNWFRNHDVAQIVKIRCITEMENPLISIHIVLCQTMFIWFSNIYLVK